MARLMMSAVAVGAVLLAGPDARCEEQLKRFVISNPSFGQVGAQTVRMDSRTDETLVSIEQEISVLFGLLFDYRSTQRELWRAGRLAEYQTSTLDGNDWHDVAARAQEDGITVNGHAHHGGDAPAEACPLNPVNRAFLECTVLIEPKKGRIWNVEIESVGEENIKIRRFSRFKLGEGIEKKSENFADEVMSQISGTA